MEEFTIEEFIEHFGRAEVISALDINHMEYVSIEDCVEHFENDILSHINNDDLLTELSRNEPQLIVDWFLENRSMYDYMDFSDHLDAYGWSDATRYIMDCSDLEDILNPMVKVFNKKAILEGLKELGITQEVNVDMVLLRALLQVNKLEVELSDV